MAHRRSDGTPSHVVFLARPAALPLRTGQRRRLLRYAELEPPQQHTDGEAEAPVDRGADALGSPAHDRSMPDRPDREHGSEHLRHRGTVHVELDDDLARLRRARGGANGRVRARRSGGGSATRCAGTLRPRPASSSNRGSSSICSSSSAGTNSETTVDEQQRRRGPRRSSADRRDRARPVGSACDAWCGGRSVRRAARCLPPVFGTAHAAVRSAPGAKRSGASHTVGPPQAPSAPGDHDERSRRRPRRGGRASSEAHRRGERVGPAGATLLRQPARRAAPDVGRRAARRRACRHRRRRERSPDGPPFGRLDRVAQQHDDRGGSDPAEAGRDPRRDLGRPTRRRRAAASGRA